ncbi:MAG TPA: hypothetical protein VFP45_03445 [Candidatus Nitrosotalea sp.]|nr:hypothetical protein [Candidatus Nitrosotalea sp.]
MPVDFGKVTRTILACSIPVILFVIAEFAMSYQDSPDESIPSKRYSTLDMWAMIFCFFIIAMKFIFEESRDREISVYLNQPVVQKSFDQPIDREEESDEPNIKEKEKTKHKCSVCDYDPQESTPAVTEEQTQ